MGSKSRVLVIGATGYIGQYIALAGPALGHPTFALVRSSALSSKASLIHSFKAAGISILEGSVEDHESLVAAIKQVDVVISALPGSSTLDQLNIIEAIKEVGTIKRFFPSEFGIDVDRVHALEPANTAFGLKVQVRRATEAAGIPYTYLVTNGFTGYYLPSLLHLDPQSPLRDKVSIYGSGDAKFFTASEEDVGAYTIRTVDDPRTLNKTLHIRPVENLVSINSLMELWEQLSDRTLEKKSVSEEDIVKQIQETPFPNNLLLAILHNTLFQGDQHNFELGPNDVEATTLCPDHKYTMTKEYLAKFV